MKNNFCPNCQNKIEWSKTVLSLKRGDFEAKIKGVPAQICKNCREVFIPGSIAEPLSEFAESTAAKVEKASKSLIPI